MIAERAFRRDRLPYVIAAALLLGVAVGVALVAVSGWRGALRYTALPAVTLPLPPASDAPGTEAAASVAAGVGEPGPPAAAVEAAGTRRVAIVVTGLGLAREPSERALLLPGGMGLAVSPYADDPAAWLARIAAAGHRPLLVLPLEAADPARVDPGPLAISLARSPAERAGDLAAILDRGRGAVAVTVEPGAFARAADQLAPIAGTLAERGLALVETGDPHLAEIARGSGLAYGATGPALDEVPNAAAIDQALARLESRSALEGAAIGWGRLYPVTLERLSVWAAGLAEKGIGLVPVDTLLASAGVQAGPP